MPSQNKTFRGLAAIVIACGLCVAPAAAGTFSSLVVFGDSLSDVLGFSRATAYRHWNCARAWLRCEIEGTGDSTGIQETFSISSKFGDTMMVFLAA